MMSTWITKWWLFWPKVFKTALLNSHAWCLSRYGFKAGLGRVPLLSIWYQGLSTCFLHHGSQPSYVTSQDSKKCSQRQEVEAASLLGLACIHIYLQCTMWCFDICIHHEIITTIKLIYPLPHRVILLFLCNKNT